jgi:TRAP-type C4-dicarboxylate transport system permease small subunit
MAGPEPGRVRPARVARIHRTLWGIARGGSWFGGVLILGSAFVVTADVLMRKFWGVTLGGADLIAGYALAIASAWGFGFAFLGRAHIRIDSFYVRMPAWLRIAVDFAGIGLMLAFFGLVTWYAIGVVAQSAARGSRSISALQIPVAVPQAIWVAGLLFFLLAMLLTLLLAIPLAASGRHAELQRLIGSKSADEEVAEERTASGLGP